MNFLKNRKNKLIMEASINAASTVAYVALVSWFLYNGERIFGKMNGFVGPFAILLLLVVSVSVTGMFIFGKPIILFFNKERKDAMQLLTYTILGLIIAMLVMFSFFILIK